MNGSCLKRSASPVNSKLTDSSLGSSALSRGFSVLRAILGSWFRYCRLKQVSRVVVGWLTEWWINLCSTCFECFSRHLYVGKPVQSFVCLTLICFNACITVVNNLPKKIMLPNSGKRVGGHCQVTGQRTWKPFKSPSAQWPSTCVYLGKIAVFLQYCITNCSWFLENLKTDGSSTYGIWVINKVHLYWSVSCGKQIKLLLFISMYQGHA